MKSLRLVQLVRAICNAWPQYAFIKPAVLAKHSPEPLDNYDSKGAALLEASRDKQAYLQSLDQPGA